MQWSGVLPHESRSVGSARSLRRVYRVFRCRNIFPWLEKNTCRCGLRKHHNNQALLHLSDTQLIWLEIYLFDWRKDDEVSCLIRLEIVYLGDSATPRFFECPHHNFGRVLRFYRLFLRRTFVLEKCDQSGCHCSSCYFSTQIVNWAICQ